VVATGRRVLLRPPAARDRDQLLALVRASRRLHGRWSRPPATPQAYALFLSRYQRPEQVALLACCREDGRIVGVFMFMEIVRGHFHSAYLGYWAGARFAGQGYMREALTLVLRHAFTRLGLHRLEANIQPGNTASIALVRGAGFRREGFSPRYLKVAGRWRDHERWALLAEEWRALRRRSVPRARVLRTRGPAFDTARQPRGRIGSSSVR
jgi:[ribosomal protein S5]-alanine N-acetyltransferase